MKKERLKDRLRTPGPSTFASILKLVILLMAMFAVFFTLREAGVFPTSLLPKKDLSLPANSPSAPLKSAIPVTLTATANHTFYFGNAGPYPIAQARPVIARWLQTTREAHVFIDGDASATLGDTMQLYDEARRLGIADVQIKPAVHKGD